MDDISDEDEVRKGSDVANSTREKGGWETGFGWLVWMASNVILRHLSFSMLDADVDNMHQLLTGSYPQLSSIRPSVR